MIEGEVIMRNEIKEEEEKLVPFLEPETNHQRNLLIFPLPLLFVEEISKKLRKKGKRCF